MIKLHSFLSYELVEADLLKCMPALGDRIKVGFDEIDKTLRAYIWHQSIGSIGSIVHTGNIPPVK